MNALPYISTLSPIGIDFGASGIKMVQLRARGGEFKPVAAAAVPWSPVAAERRLSDSVVKAIEQQLRVGGFHGRRCIVSLPRVDLRAHSVRMPRLPSSELRQAVGWEAAERFQLDRETIETDYIRLGEIHRAGESRDEILLIAAERQRINALLEPLLDLGLRPIAIDSSMTALVRLHSTRCRRESDVNHVRAIVDVGASGTSILVARGDQIGLCKSIDIGGRHFDQHVAEHLGIEPDMACELRRRRPGSRPANDRSAATQASADRDEEPRTEQPHHGGQERVRTPNSDGGDPRDRAVFESVRSALDQICKEVALCLRYYGVTFRGQPPDRIILSGGDGTEPHFGEMLARTCNVRVSMDDPVSPVEGVLSPIPALVDESTRPAESWAVAAGLGLRGLLKRRMKDAPAAIKNEMTTVAADAAA